MAKNERIVRYTADEIEAMRRRGEDRTDYAWLDALTEEELEASIDTEEEGEFDWSTARIDLPGPKQQLTVRFDRDVVDWFKAQGAGYQARMNAVPGSYADAQTRERAAARRGWWGDRVVGGSGPTSPAPIAFSARVPLPDRPTTLV